MCILRDLPPASAMECYESCLPYRDMIVGIGLDSDEEGNPPQLFDEVFSRAREDGFRITAHCDVGMSQAMANIHHVLSALGATGADRLDHGLNAATDESLIDMIKTRKMGMTLTPYGYLRHRSADEVFDRIAKLYRAGVRIAIGSDDPAYMEDTWLLANWLWVKKYCGLDDGDMVNLARSAVEMCWAPEDVKKGILAEIERVAAEHIS
jgi:adenosine deaminase